MDESINMNFTELNDTELKLLCFLAYHGEGVGISSGSEYRKYARISKKSYSEIIDKLNKCGFIDGKTHVKPTWHVKILKELYTNHTEWVGKFKNICMFSRNNVAEYLCTVVNLLLSGDYARASTLKRPFVDLINHKQLNLLSYLQPATEEDIRFVKMLNDYDVKDMVSEQLNTSFFQDELKKESFDVLRRMLTDKNKFRKDILNEINVYEFLQYGTYDKESQTPSIWTEAIRATLLVYEDKYEESVDVFHDAIRQYSKSEVSFPIPVFNYIYGIALYKLSKRNVSNATSKLKAFLNDRNIKYKDENFCIRLLLASIDGVHDETGRSSYIISRHQEKMYNSFVYLLHNLFEKPITSLTANKLHSSAFFQHEVSAFLPIGPDAKKHYQEIFGGSPLIGKLRKRPTWEIAFQEIENSIVRHNDREQRIAYYVDKYDLQAIVLQTKEDGEWHDGQILSLSQMIKNGYDIMDSKDAMIANSLSDNNGYENAAKVIVPILADSDRLYYGSYYEGNRQRAKVHHVKPFLSFEGKGEVIEIKANVGMDERGYIQKHTLTHTGTAEYTLTTVNPFQRDVMKKFISLNNVPSTAIVSLKKAIESLQGIVDVKDGELESLMRPATYSKGVLAIRIIPKKHNYELTIMASAMENGTSRFVPAEGEQLVYDEVENITLCINRDFNREYTNYAQIKEFIEEDINCQFDSYTEAIIGTPESLLRFLAFIHDNQDKYFIEWPEGKPLRFKGDIKTGDIEINVKSDVDWFCVEGEVKTNNLHLSLEALIRSCCNSQIEGFIKIGEDEYVRMSEELKKHIAAFNSLPSTKGRGKTIPKYQVSALASMIHELKINEDGGYTDFMQKTREAYSLSPEVPDGLNAKLRDYQIEGFKWMCRLSAWGAGACLADDMGLGKTLQAITFLLYKSKEGPSLVIAPKSVLLNWEREIARFAPELNCININNAKKRDKIINAATAKDIVLCTYGVLGTQGEYLSKKDWNVVCLDEAHQIKNRNTLASRTSMELKACNRLILTGTPIQNNLGELWNLFQFINPGLLGTWSVFRDSFMIPSLDSEHRELLKEMTTPFILRRTKQDVLTELPEKIVSERLVDLTENEQKVYEEMRKRAELKFKKYKSKDELTIAKSIDINFFTELTHLREAACSMRMVYDEWSGKSSKIETLMEILDTIMSSPDNNVIVFSQFTCFLDLIKPELHRHSMSYLYLDGQTSMQKRQKYVEDFQEGRCRLFLSSLKAGGFGINLTKANYVIILDPWWNPSVENQAMDRAHRLGQKRVVTVIRLISAQTIEEKILRLHEDKQQLADDILDGTGESNKLTYEDIMDMVSPF